ncbi:hypothetical protein Tco_1309811 [Tanacetum coccineum]
MSNINNTMPTQTSSVLHNDRGSSCSTFKVQEKIQLSRSRCMHSLKEIKSLFKFLSETLQDYGTMPIFKRTFSQDLDLLEQHLTKDIISQTDCKTTLTKLITTFKNAFNLEFEERMRKYTRYNAQSFNDAMICTIDSIRKYMLEIILHQQRTLHLLKQKTLMQTQEDHSNQTQALNSDSLKVDLVVKQNSCSEKEDTVDQNYKELDKEEISRRWIHESLLGGKQPVPKVHLDSKFTLDYDSQMTDTYFVEYTGIEVQHFRDTLLQHLEDADTESKIDTGKALDADLDTIYDEEPMAEVQLTAGCNIFAIGQQHTEQPEIINEGRVDQIILEIVLRTMPRFSSNDMVHNHYLDEARKKTQERDRNSKTSVMPSARFQSTADGSKPKPRRNNQTSRSLPVSKSSRVTITVVPKADHSGSSSFSDSKNFVCSTCHKCVFNANHDACITKLLKEVNSRAKIQSHKTRNSNKPVDQKSHTQKPGRQIFTGHRFSPNKTSAVYEKTSPRSDLRWKPTGKNAVTYIESTLGTSQQGNLVDDVRAEKHPVKGESLNLPDPGLDDGVAASFQWKSDS